MLKKTWFERKDLISIIIGFPIVSISAFFYLIYSPSSEGMYMLNAIFCTYLGHFIIFGLIGIGLVLGALSFMDAKKKTYSLAGIIFNLIALIFFFIYWNWAFRNVK